MPVQPYFAVPVVFRFGAAPLRSRSTRMAKRMVGEWRNRDVAPSAVAPAVCNAQTKHGACRTDFAMRRPGKAWNNAVEARRIYGKRLFCTLWRVDRHASGSWERLASSGVRPSVGATDTAVVVAEEVAKQRGGLITRVTRGVTSPPAVMCAVACLMVLAGADYRDERYDPLSAAMRPPEAVTRDAFPLGCVADDLPTAPIPTKSVSRTVRTRGLSATGYRLLRMALPVGPDEMLVPRDDSGGWAVGHAAAPLERRVRVVSGEIHETFTRGAIQSGVPEAIVSQVADVLGWDFDFSKDLEPGARFRIAYEELVRHGRPASDRLLAAEIQSGGEWHEAYYFAPERGGEGGYFDGQGRALGRRFLRYPVAYTRISSGFSARRLHPVLRIHRPHYGVDFAAPVGTPVRAVASGVITRAGWYGSSGRVVKMRHDDAYETGYAHLSRVAEGIRPGVHVERGDTVGYVGMSGMATGPHLHFALYVGGRYADPLKIELPRPRSLHGRRLVAFNTGVTGFSRMLAAADRVPVDEPIVTAALFN